MLDDIRSFADVQAALSLATEPTLVTLNDRGGEFIVVSVTVDTSVDNIAEGTEIELVEYDPPDPASVPAPLRQQLLSMHLLMAQAEPATSTSTLGNVKTFKKPPNG